MNDISYELDAEILKKWGFRYSDTDDDPIIDTLDYGHNNISYKDFTKRMDGYKLNFEKNGSFGSSPFISETT